MGMPIFNAYFHLLGRWRWSLLLALLIGSFLLQPYWPHSPAGDLASFTLYNIVLVGAIYMGRARPWIKHATFGLLSLAFVLEVFDVLGGDPDAMYAGAIAGLMLVIILIVLVMTFAQLVVHHERTYDGLIGAIFGYLLIGVMWMQLYRRLDVWYPGSFNLPAGELPSTSLLYFSLSTLTTVGFGDIVPLRPHAQISAGFEAAAGTLYIAVLIGRIVSQLKLHEPPATVDQPKRDTDRDAARGGAEK
ncbi:ion channel [Rhizobiaceae bacterium n13]|uniref:Ion channel n=1 Tax=Ferirhizobium litorale TaxID=2927786 RepID=A0AAE3QHP8_9HYPH|nr:ion channel [Fererhizobium litorale]MDI7863817.1 ion channel [Fererhizobium litorale]MDI7924083.1 ion channel [Fererhizobium litorale]